MKPASDHIEIKHTTISCRLGNPWNTVLINFFWDAVVLPEDYTPWPLGLRNWVLFRDPAYGESDKSSPARYRSARYPAEHVCSRGLSAVLDCAVWDHGDWIGHGVEEHCTIFYAKYQKKHPILVMVLRVGICSMKKTNKNLIVMNRWYVGAIEAILASFSRSMISPILLPLDRLMVVVFQLIYM